MFCTVVLALASSRRIDAALCAAEGVTKLEGRVAAARKHDAERDRDGADVFRTIAKRIVDDVAPPTNMAGCSARMLNLVNAALAAKE